MKVTGKRFQYKEKSLMKYKYEKKVFVVSR